MDVSRRQFLKITCLTTASIALPLTGKNIFGEVWAYPNFNPNVKLRTAVRFKISENKEINQDNIVLALKRLETWAKERIPTQYRERLEFRYRVFDYGYYSDIAVFYNPKTYKDSTSINIKKMIKEMKHERCISI